MEVVDPSIASLDFSDIFVIVEQDDAKCKSVFTDNLMKN